MKNKLTAKQEKFAQELAKGKSQRVAYRAAYPNSRKWKDSVVDSRASTMFNKNDKVMARYNELRARVVKEAEDECIASAKDVIKELAKIAFSNGTDFAQVVTKEREKLVQDPESGEFKSCIVVEQFVEFKDSEQLDDNKKAAIVGIKQGKFGIEINTCDKVKALELLGKHLGIFTDKIDIKADVQADKLNSILEQLRE